MAATAGLLLAGLIALAGGQQTPPIFQPGAPGAASRVVTPAEALALLPSRGRGWHHISAVRTALDLGKLRLKQIKHAFYPSASLKADVFSAAMASVMHALPADDVVLGDGTVANLRKDAANKLVGLWGRRKHQRLRTTCSQTAQEEDLLCCGAGETIRREVGVGDWVDFFHIQEMVGRHTYYLLHRSVLDQEACLLARKNAQPGPRGDHL